MSVGEDIDLIEFMKFSCRKYTLIIVVILLFIISGGLFYYLNGDKTTVTMNVTPKMVGQSREYAGTVRRFEPFVEADWLYSSAQYGVKMGDSDTYI